MSTSPNKAEAPLTTEHQLWVSAVLLATLNEILDAVTLVLRGKFGTLALYDAARNTRQIVAYRGFDADYLKAIGMVSIDTGLAGSRSIRQRKRVIVSDVNEDPEYEPYREFARKAGYRTVQATPLLSRDGEVLGALVTHLAEPREFSDHELQILDRYFRQAADAATLTKSAGSPPEIGGTFALMLAGTGAVQGAFGGKQSANDKWGRVVNSHVGVVSMQQQELPGISYHAEFSNETINSAPSLRALLTRGLTAW